MYAACSCLACSTFTVFTHAFAYIHCICALLSNFLSLHVLACMLVHLTVVCGLVSCMLELLWCSVCVCACVCNLCVNCMWCVLMSCRECPGDVHCIAFRSVIHSEMPPVEDKLRAEVSPSGYFIHPCEGGSLISYCIQIDTLQYGPKGGEFVLEVCVCQSMCVCVFVCLCVRAS